MLRRRQWRAALLCALPLWLLPSSISRGAETGPPPAVDAALVAVPGDAASLAALRRIEAEVEALAVTEQH